MGVFGNAVVAIIRKPFTVIYMGVVVLVLCILWRINPVFPLIAGLARAADTDFFEQVISMLQFFMQRDVLLYLVPGIAVISLGMGILSSIFMSGYFHVLNDSINKASSKNTKGIFYGIKLLFARVFVVSSIAAAAFCVFALFMLVASVPLMIMMRAVSIEKPQMLLISVLVMVLTALVLFLGSMYFRIYIFLWYPAAVNNHKKPFRAGKKVADRCFWKLVFAFLIFDMVFILVMVIFTYFDDSIYLFAVRWLFLTLYATLLSSYVFSAYKLKRGHG